MNVKKENSSTMIKITANCDNFLQSYASANSGDSSGSKCEKNSNEKSNSLLHSFNPPPKSSHVRFNSLVDVSKNFKKHKKYKHKLLNDSFTGMRTVLGKVDTNANLDHTSNKYYHSNLNQTQNLHLNHSDHFRGASEEADLMHYTYDN